MRPKLLNLVDTKAIQKFRASRGFTLIELLVVITIIAILASVAFPVVNGVMARARKVRALAVAKDLQVAIKSYQTEYNRYPDSADDGDVTLMTNDGDLISILMGENSDNRNPREIKFVDLPMSKNGSGGLVSSGGSVFTLVDEWKEPYVVIMDTDYDNRIDNPDTSNSDPKVSSGAPPELPIGVAVYSTGPDTQASTKDDVTSWRG
jgi:prepilin-type N-terminal cleavage/methylation domain-containing protein